MDWVARGGPVERPGCAVSTFVLHSSPCCCPLPGVAHRSVLPKNPLVASVPEATLWLTLCHIVLRQRWRRQSSVGWCWEVAGDLHTDTHMVAHTYTCLQQDMRPRANTVYRNTPRGAPTHTSCATEPHLGIDLLLCAWTSASSRGRIRQTQGTVHTGPQMFFTLCTLHSWGMAILGSEAPETPLR